MLFRPRSRQISYSFQRTLGSSTVKALGVLFTESLSWNEHHEYVHTKASKSVGLLCRNRYIFPTSVKLLLYYSLVYTHYVYCHLVWGQTTKHNLTRLLLTQKRAIRIVSNVSFLHLSKELFFKHPVIPIEQLHRFRLLVTYNVALKHNNTFFISALSCLTKLDHKYVTRHGETWNVSTPRTNYGFTLLKYVLPSLLNDFDTNDVCIFGKSIRMLADILLQSHFAM